MLSKCLFNFLGFSEVDANTVQHKTQYSFSSPSDFIAIKPNLTYESS